MYRILTLVILAILFSPSLKAQWTAKPLSFAEDSIQIDGQLNEQSWAFADPVWIVNGGDSIKVRTLYNNTNLYFAFTGKLESANALFPEILIDADNQRAATWQTNDWWFHVSATDCENKGAYGVYNNCMLVQPGWRGVPNFSPGMPMTDTVEIAIPLSKLETTIQAGNTINISVLVTNTFSIYRHWPATADRNNPSTWGTLSFVFQTGLQAIEPENPLFRVVHNQGNELRLLFPSSAKQSVTLMDYSGRIVQTIPKTSSDLVTFHHVKHGIYLIKTETGPNVYFSKIVVNE